MPGSKSRLRGGSGRRQEVPTELVHVANEAEFGAHQRHFVVAGEVASGDHFDQLRERHAVHHLAVRRRTFEARSTPALR